MPPNTANVKVDYPSLSMDFIAGDYILFGTHYATLPSFLTAAGGSFTRNSVGTYFDSAGVMQTATAHTPRFDYDPVTLQPKGLLIEEQRTNLLLQSQNFNAVGWNVINVVRSCGQADPAGGVTACRVTASLANGFLNRPAVAAIGGTYTNSIWVRRVFWIGGSQNWRKYYRRCYCSCYVHLAAFQCYLY
jgi:hypothetical protein